MKTLITTFICLIVGTSISFGQEQSTSDDSEKLTGFAWLQRFEGTWEVTSKTPTAEQSAGGQKAMIQSRTIGNRWIVNEHSGTLGEGITFEAVQTIGYDADEQRFTGTWIDSMLSHTWNYSGSLDESGKRLMLETEGPDWTDLSKMKKYRDVYEFKSDNEILGLSQVMNNEGEWETFMSSTITRSVDSNSKTSVTPFLMFIGEAESAINFYKTVFPDTQVESMTKYAAGDNGKEGTVKLATIVIAGQRIKCIDSPAVHDFDFTPSFSFFVECENEEQLKQRFEKLSDGGEVMMPLGNYGFSSQFGWVSDKFGVSWQLNLQ